MSSKIQAQAVKFWQSIVSVETVNAYTTAFDVTWTIIKEAAVLLWLVLCLVLVVFDWGYDTATSAGRNTRTWWDGLSKEENSDLAAETGKQLMAASKASLYSTVSQARSQLGLPNKPKPTESAEAKVPSNGSSTTSSSAPSSVSTTTDSGVSPSSRQQSVD